MLWQAKEMRSMRRISRQDYQKMIQNGHVLASRGNVTKEVIELPQGEIIKCFPYKKNRLRNYFWPKVNHFLKNAAQLKRRGILSVEPIACYHCCENKAFVLRYRKLSGQSIRDLNNCTHNEQEQRQRLHKTVQFLASVHEKGIDFRGCHLGNFVLTEQGQFAIIDMENLKFRLSLLSLRRRGLSLSYLLSHRHDIALLYQLKFDDTITAYLNATHLSPADRKSVCQWVNIGLKCQLNNRQDEGFLPSSVSVNMQCSDT